MLEKLRRQLADVQARAKVIIESEERSEAADANLSELLDEGERIQARIAELEKLEQLTAAARTLDRIESGAASRSSEQHEQRDERSSAGELLVRSAQFGEYRGFGSTSPLEVRALPTGTDAFGQFGPAVLDTALPSLQVPLLDLIPTIQVSGNSYDWITFTKVAGGATKVAEKAAKPSAEWAPTVTPITLDTFAVYTQLTRQILEDLSAVRTLVDTELAREVRRAQEAEAAAALAAATLPTAEGADLLAAIRVGIGTVEAAGYMPNGVILNPADYAALDIAVMGGTLGGPEVRQRFWGLTPVAASSQPAGTATVGDFAAGVQRHVRTGVNLYITDSHADTFIKNVFTILAEGREKTIVVRPAALVECSKTVV
jgi:HK97 family phage major capsid protein